MMPHPALAGLQPPSAAAAAALSAGLPPSNSTAAGLLALSTAGSLAGAASVANSNNSIPGMGSALSRDKESSHRESYEKRALNGQIILNLKIIINHKIFK